MIFQPEGPFASARVAREDLAMEEDIRKLRAINCDQKH